MAVAGDLAHEVSTYRFSGRGEEGPIEDRGKAAVVWTKVDGEWKVAADIFNSDGPES